MRFVMISQEFCIAISMEMWDCVFENPNLVLMHNIDIQMHMFDMSLWIANRNIRNPLIY